jgi:hypothetical protein
MENLRRVNLRIIFRIQNVATLHNYEETHFSFYAIHKQKSRFFDINYKENARPT